MSNASGVDSKLRHKPLSSLPAFLPLVAIIVALTVADRWVPIALIWYSLSVLSVLFAWVARQYPGWVVANLSIALAAAAAGQYSLTVSPVGEHNLSRVIESGVAYHVYGEVADWPTIRGQRTDILIAVDSLRYRDGGRVVEGKLLLKITDTTTVLQRGDRVAFRSTLYRLPENRPDQRFDYRRWLGRQEVQALAYLPTTMSIRVAPRATSGWLGVVDRTRAWIVTTFRSNLPADVAALASGFLIGETRDIPIAVYERFRDTGTLHVLAVSGSNVALVLGFVWIILRRFPLTAGGRRFVLAGVLVLFLLLSYAEPSVVRASVMAGLVLLARHLGRRVNLEQVILVAALLILIVSPSQLFDVGWQLSFIVAGGLIWFTPRVSRFFPQHHGQWYWTWLALPLLVAVIAQVVSMPIIAYHFGRVPLLSVPANLIVVPMVSLIVIGSLVLLAIESVVPMLSPLVGSLIALPAQLVLDVLAWFDLSGELAWTLPAPGASLFWPIVIGAAYAGLMLAVAAFRSHRPRRLLVGLVAGLAVFTLARCTTDHDRPAQWTIEPTRIPGGVVVVIRQPDYSGSDIVITTLAARDYPIDERILLPLFEDVDAHPVRRVVVMGLDFAAVPALLRIREALVETEIWVSEQAFASIVHHDSAATGRLLWYPETEPIEATGLVPGADQTIVSVDGHPVSIRRSWVADPTIYSPGGLIIGTGVVPPVDQLVALTRQPPAFLVAPFLPPQLDTTGWAHSLSSEPMPAFVLSDSGWIRRDSR